MEGDIYKLFYSRPMVQNWHTLS